jgi:hypothetical protein
MRSMRIVATAAVALAAVLSPAVAQSAAPPAGFQENPRLGGLASALAGRSTQVFCATTLSAWIDFNAQFGWDVAHLPVGLTQIDSGLIYLAPNICTGLERLAADPNPQCPTVAFVKKVTYKPVRVRIRVHGKLRTVLRRKRIVTTTAVEGPPKRCAPSDDDAEPLLVLAHEAMHAAGNAGEEVAECYGLQHVYDVAVGLGVTPEAARSYATYAWQTIYPNAHAGYVSDACRDGGPLDLRPETAVWP